MDNYDATMTMSYLAAVPMAMTNSGRQIESFDNSMLSVDVPDHHSTFDVDTFAG
jgi:thymidine phosphorylase